jgi:hypothetical protein
MKISEFSKYISGRGGVARTNKYQVILPSSDTVDTNDLNLLCESATLPFLQIATKDRMIGPKPIKTGYGRITDDVTMTFLVTNDYLIKKYFDYWQSSVVNLDTYEVGYYKNYVRDITINQLNDGFKKDGGNKDGGNEIIYSCVLKDAYPTNVSQIDLNNNPDELVRIQVQFSYRDWEEKDDTLYKNKTTKINQNSL